MNFCDPERTTVKCPYIPDHVMHVDSLLTHLVRCKATNKHQFQVCEYNSLHVVRKTLYKDHLMYCLNRAAAPEDDDEYWGNTAMIQHSDNSLVDSRYSSSDGHWFGNSYCNQSFGDYQNENMERFQYKNNYKKVLPKHYSQQNYENSYDSFKKFRDYREKKQMQNQWRQEHKRNTADITFMNEKKSQKSQRSFKKVTRNVFSEKDTEDCSLKKNSKNDKSFAQSEHTQDQDLKMIWKEMDAHLDKNKLKVEDFLNKSGTSDAFGDDLMIHVKYYKNQNHFVDNSFSSRTTIH